MVSFVTSTLNKIYPVLETLGSFLHYQIPENWYEPIDPSPMLLPLHRCYCPSTDVIAPPPMLLTPHRCYCPSAQYVTILALLPFLMVAQHESGTRTVPKKYKKLKFIQSMQDKRNYIHRYQSWYLVCCLGKRWACSQWSFQIC
jgi:hypothetical protein